MSRPRLEVAVVGAGIAGLGAARELQRRGHLVQIFEAAKHAGGHTYTVELDDEGRRLAIDMGFIVYNERTYPNFVSLLAELGVSTEPSSMSFSVRCEKTGLEYCGSSLRQLFAQKRNLFSPRFYRMLAGIARFHREAPADLLEADPRLSLREYLGRKGFPQAFVDFYLLPMTSAIWSTPAGAMLDFPARSLARFLHNHGMLQVKDRPVWRVVSGGSARYVEKMIAPLASGLHLATPVNYVRRGPGWVELHAGGRSRRFDALVLATHSDTALRLLADPSAAEERILGALPYADSEVVLHTDASFLPRRKAAWSSWNCHLPRDGAAGAGATQLTYSMNILQNLDSSRQYCVTLNRSAEIDESKVLHRISLAHPQFTTAGLAAQERWSELARERTFFAGAYWFYGFHEDGYKSGLRAAEAIEAAAPRLAAPRLDAARPAARRTGARPAFAGARP